MKFLLYLYKQFQFYNAGYPVNPRKLFLGLIKSQYWDDDQYHSHQVEQLNRLLKSAKESSEFYENKFSNITLPINSIDDFFEKASTINKSEIIKNTDRISTCNYSTGFKHTTSGSSGDPLSLNISPLAEAYRKASVLRFQNWWGIKQTDKSVLIWGRKTTPHQNNTWLNKIKAQLRNRYDINVFELNERSIFTFFSDIEEMRPVYFRGYKSAIIHFAELMEKSKLKFHKTKLKVVIVTSEILLDTEREYLKKIYGCAVANEYGAAEAGLFAYECPNGSMHINEECVLISTNKNNELLVTELFNDFTPLIQYKIGDSIKISDEKCECGRTSRIIETIEGRSSDYVVKPDGTKLSQYIFYYIVKELDDIGFAESILKYKIVQKANKFSFYIVRGKRYKPEILDYISKRITQEIGNEIFVDFNIVDVIEREKSGKLRFFVRER
ncbi:MAG: hypothetical protein K8F60_14035 [Melioribacteraceae bacterium]|nr:hypothetical protein [Melioribacteraceae bacterium]